MYVCKDGKLLKTKIVATMGKPRPLNDPAGPTISESEAKSDFWNLFLNGFFENDMFLIDVLRLNMAFFEPPGDPERCILQWVKQNAGKLKNVAVLGDLSGPKLRLRDISPSIKTVKSEDKVTLLINKRNPGNEPSTCSVCVGEHPVGYLDPTLWSTLVDGKLREITIGDNNVVLDVVRIHKDRLECVVRDGGALVDKRGITLENIPPHKLQLRAFTDEDKAALDFLIDEGYDWTENFTDPNSHGSVLAFVGVSFVKTKQDVIDVKRYAYDSVRRHLAANKPQLTKSELDWMATLYSPAIIAKIETPEGWKNIDEILDIADGAMVARGDLAKQMGPEEVPKIQKQLIRLCNLRGKPVITATEMLASMVDKPSPTRAEANDVFNAITDGSDAVMLSNETSEGMFPFSAVRRMVRIAEAAEKHYENFGRRNVLAPPERRLLKEQRFGRLLVGAEELYKEVDRRLLEGLGAAGDPWLENLYRGKYRRSVNQRITDRISEAACALSNSSRPDATVDGGNAAGLPILAASTSGRTVRMISRFRPEAQIIGAVHDAINRRKMVISYGVWPLNCGRTNPGGGVFDCCDDVFQVACTIAKQEGFFGTRGFVVFTAGMPLFDPGSTNLIQIRPT